MKTKSVLLLFILVSVLLLYSVFHDPQRMIIAKARPAPVKSAFSPVLIYRLTESTKLFAGLGSMTTDAEGEQVITCEHLLSGNGPEGAKYAFRRIYPLEPGAAHGLRGIAKTSSELAKDSSHRPDVVILQGGEPTTIRPIAGRNWSQVDPHSTLKRLNKTMTLKSLLSGEKVSVVGTITLPRDGDNEYFLLEYRPGPFESGLGFIDEAGRLYVLTGTLDVSRDQRAQVLATLGTDKRLVLAHGPLKRVE